MESKININQQPEWTYTLTNHKTLKHYSMKIGITIKQAKWTLNIIQSKIDFNINQSK